MKYYKLQELCIDIIDCPHSTPNWKNEGIRVVRNFNLKDGNIDFTDGWNTFYYNIKYYGRKQNII